MEKIYNFEYPELDWLNTTKPKEHLVYYFGTLLYTQFLIINLVLLYLDLQPDPEWLMPFSVLVSYAILTIALDTSFYYTSATSKVNGFWQTNEVFKIEPGKHNYVFLKKSVKVYDEKKHTIRLLGDFQRANFEIDKIFV